MSQNPILNEINSLHKEINSLHASIAKLNLKITDSISEAEWNRSLVQDLTKRLEQLENAVSCGATTNTKENPTATDVLSQRVNSLDIATDCKEKPDLRSDIREFIYDNTSFHYTSEKSILDDIMEKCVINTPLDHVLAEIMKILYNRTGFHHTLHERIAEHIHHILSNHSFK
jgi:regulator of replication initiation timing